MKFLLVNKSQVTDEEGNLVDTSDVYNLEFLEEVNNLSNKYGGMTDYTNEIFLYYYLPFFEKYSFIKKSLIEKVFIKGWKGLFWFEAAKKSGISFSILRKSGFFIRALYLLLISFFIMFALLIILPVFTIFRFRNYKIYTPYANAFAVIRAPATLSKMSFLEAQGVVFFCDDLIFKSSGLLSIYQTPLKIKLLSLFYVPFFGILEFFALFKDAKKMLGFLLACDVIKYYIKRIPHKVNLQFYVERLFKRYSAATFYTGNKRIDLLF